ncbi:type II secretion system protein N [Croceicoccus mobilis]|uniref:type II secretion system protein N n=1 Tax=Croceicoccus mobilis TaxID=1703339 RepID=UPI001E4C57EC|nr:type II secretion system protein N [Croceicoccus mobilis]
MIWWLLAAGIVIAGVALFWMVVTPVSPLGQWRPASVNVMSPAARSALMGSFDPFNRMQPRPELAAGPERVTDLPLTLYGLRYNAATGSGTAIIADNDGEQKIFRIGDEVTPDATLAGIAFDHVVISRSGARELLYLDQSKPAPVAQAATGPSRMPQPPSSDVIDPNAVSASALRGGVSVQPEMKGASFAGLSVYPNGNGSAFDAAGLQAGDIVTAIGGKPITSAGEAGSLVRALVPGRQVSLTVRRDGRDVPVQFQVAP